MIVCPACGTRELTVSERLRRFSRCRFCRSTKPRGKVKPKVSQGISINPPKLKAPKTTETWWQRPEFADRAKFQAECWRRNPGSQVGLIMNHAKFGDGQ